MLHHIGQLKKISKSNGWNVFAFIKELKPFVLSKLAMWGIGTRNSKEVKKYLKSKERKRNTYLCEKKEITKLHQRKKEREEGTKEERRRRSSNRRRRYVLL